MTLISLPRADSSKLNSPNFLRHVFRAIVADSVTLNLEGVALIVLTALGLLFALMTCVFYEHIIAKCLGALKINLFSCCAKSKSNTMEVFQNGKLKDNVLNAMIAAKKFKSVANEDDNAGAGRENNGSRNSAKTNEDLEDSTDGETNRDHCYWYWHKANLHKNSCAVI